MERTHLSHGGDDCRCVTTGRRYPDYTIVVMPQTTAGSNTLT
jgi:hypothetical protein